MIDELSFCSGTLLWSGLDLYSMGSLSERFPFVVNNHISVLAGLNTLKARLLWSRGGVFFPNADMHLIQQHFHVLTLCFYLYTAACHGEWDVFMYNAFKL